MDFCWRCIVINLFKYQIWFLLQEYELWRNISYNWLSHFSVGKIIYLENVWECQMYLSLLKSEKSSPLERGWFWNAESIMQSIMFTIGIDFCWRKTDNAISAHRIRFPFNAEISFVTIALILTPQISGSTIGQLFLGRRKKYIGKSSGVLSIWRYLFKKGNQKKYKMEHLF